MPGSGVDDRRKGLIVIMAITRITKYILFPFKILRQFTFTRFCNMFRYIQREGWSATKKRFKECVFGTEMYHRELVVSKVKQIASLSDCKALEFPYHETPLVTVVIPVYNEFSLTYHCLQSILQANDQTPYEIIIADDCSTDLTTGLSEIARNITISRTEENVRFLLNCNHAAREARGKYIFFLNNDTQVQDGWLDMQVALMEEKPEIGMTGAKLVYPDGRLQEAGGIIWQDGSAWNYGNRSNPDAPEYNYVKEVDYISGAAIMIRSELWNTIGGFDERFVPAYCEDSDLAWEVRKAGYKVVYQPRSVVVHFEGMSNGVDEHSGLKSYQRINQEKLYDKWKNELSGQFPQGEGVFCARERSQKKKILLMIDQYVPTFDRDAGSRTVFGFLQLFVKKGFVVKFIGDNFRFDERYTRRLEQLGIEVLYGEYYKNHIFDWLEENQSYIEYVFLNRPHISMQYIDFFCNKTKCKILYYGHDFHYLRNKREYELTGEPEKMNEANAWLEKELYLMRKADVSFFPSRVEVEEICQLDSDIKVKAITAFTFSHFPDIRRNFSQREGILFVGGFAHTPNIDAVLWFVDKIYPRICKHFEIPFVIVGSHPTLEIKAMEKRSGVTVRGFVSDEELQELYNTCKMVVVPLRYGAGVKGKVVEAMYQGCPVVTTSVGAEGIEEIETVVSIQNDEDAFAQEVLRLYQDEEALQSMSVAEVQLVKKYFSMDAVWDTMSSAFEDTGKGQSC